VGGINQSRVRIIKDIMNSEKSYVIYLLRIIDIQNSLIIHNAFNYIEYICDFS